VTLKPHWRQDRRRLLIDVGVVIHDLAGSPAPKNVVARRLAFWSRRNLRDAGIHVTILPDATITAGGIDNAIREFVWLLDLLLDGNPFESATSLPMSRLIADRLDNIRKSGIAIEIEGISDRHGKPLMMEVSNV
jgi:hypothetical protein